MADPSNAAGTPVEPVEGGTPVEPGAGTPSGEPEGGTAGEPVETDEGQRLREENERLAQANAQLLGEKSKFEQTSRENQELRQRLGGAGTVPPAQDPRAQMAAQLQQDYAVVHDPRYSVDDRIAAGARISNANIQYTRMLEADNAYARELLNVPEEDRKEVEARAQSEGVPPSWAYRAIKSDRLDKLNANPAPKPDPTTPARPSAPGRNTSVTPVAAAQLRDAGVTEAEYDRLVADAGPPKYDMNARRKIDQIDRGIIKVRTG